MNQLNNIRVNGEKLPVVVKQELYRELFCNVEKPRKVTVKGIADFLKIKGFYEKEIDITGMDTEISANLKAMIDFRRIVGQDKLKEEIIDEIIQKIIILGESKELLKNYLKKHYSNLLAEKEIIEIAKLNYSGWGRLSRAFLTEVYHADKSVGELKSIITMLWETDNNLMQLLSGGFDFIDEVNRINKENSRAAT